MATRGGKREGAGRKKGIASIKAEAMRGVLAEELEKEWIPIVLKATEQAKDGNQQAREWLSTYCIGRPAQTIVTEDEEGNVQPINGINYVIPDVKDNLNSNS